MRVLYCSNGISGHDLRFLRKISSAHDLVFCTFSGEHCDRYGVPQKIPIRSVDTKWRPGAAPSEQRKCLSQFLSILEEVKPDLVHAGPIQTVGHIAAISGFHPLIVMSWGSDILLDAKRGAEWEHITRVTMENADGFVCDCETVVDAARQYASLPNWRVANFPWGVNPGMFGHEGTLPSPTAMPFGPESFRLICTRSWEPIYRIDLLLEAFVSARKQEKRLRLILIGSGSEAGRIQRFIEQHRLRDVVLTPGKLDHTELPQWFRASSAYLSCAESDGTSVSMLEAMATGLPVLVRDLPSNREWVIPGENGWLANGMDDFAEKITLLCNLPRPELRAISECNRRLVAVRADWDKNSNRLIELYAGLTRQAAPVLA